MDLFPAPPPRPRRRRTVLAGLLLLAVLIALVVADRVAAGAVGGRVAARVAPVAGGADVEVSVGGVVLPQLLARTLDGVRVVAHDVRRGDLVVGRAVADLDGVALPSSGRPVTVDVVRLSATVAWSQVAARAAGDGAATQVGDGGDGLVAVSREVSLGGTLLPVTVLVEPVVTGDRLTLEPRAVEVLGVRRSGERVLAAVADAAPETGIDLPPLPEGLVYAGARATADGLEVVVEGADVTLGGAA